MENGKSRLSRIIDNRAPTGGDLTFSWKEGHICTVVLSQLCHGQLVAASSLAEMQAGGTAMEGARQRLQVEQVHPAQVQPVQAQPTGCW